MNANEIEKLKNGGYHFVCRDCGYDIYSFGMMPETPLLCATCAWIVDFDQDLPEEKKRGLRNWKRQK
jgi:hypothetical protein